MAAESVNSWNGGQGIFNATGTGEYHQVQLVYIDEHAQPLRPDLAVAEMIGALGSVGATNPGVDLMTGGFRSECTFPAREAFLDYCQGREAAGKTAPIWAVVGSATPNLIDCINSPPCGKCVRCDYARYKWMFRVTPTPFTDLLTSMVGFARYFLLGYAPVEWAGPLGLSPLLATGPAKLARMWGDPTPYTYYAVPIPAPYIARPDGLGQATGVKVAIVAENLIWCDPIVAYFAGNGTGAYPGDPVYPYLLPGVPNTKLSPPHPSSYLGPYCRVVGVYRPEWNAEDFSGIIADMEAKGVDFVFHIFSATAGKPYVNQWGTLQPKMISFGINVESQLQSMWEELEGRCEWEGFLNTIGTRTPLMSSAETYTGESSTGLWDAYTAKYAGASPIYTTWGAYDAIKAACENLQFVKSTDDDKLIPFAEQRVRAGLVGNFKYTGPNPGYVYNPGDFDKATPGVQPYPYLGSNPLLNGTLHDVFNIDFGSTWASPKWVRAHVTQWQENPITLVGSSQVVWERDKSYSRKYEIPDWIYDHAETDFMTSAVPAPKFGPDGQVTLADLLTVQSCYLTPAYASLLEADMDSSGFINVYDEAAVAKDLGYIAPQWPLP